MDIAVLIKQVPDTETVIKIADDKKSIKTDDIKWIMNPYDEYAVEAALRLKEKAGGKVTIVSTGPQRVVESIRTALAMGADEGVLVDDPALEGSDVFGVAKALSAVVKELNPDVILCGHRAVDYDEGQRGAAVAEMLGLPHIPFAVAIDVDDGGSKVTVDRPVEGGKMTLEASLPVLITLGGAHAIWNPRYASLPGIMKAKKKPLATKTLADLGIDASEVGPDARKIKLVSMEMPPEREPGRIIDGDLDTDGKAKELVRILKEEIKIL